MSKRAPVNNEYSAVNYEASAGKVQPGFQSSNIGSVKNRASVTRPPVVSFRDVNDFEQVSYREQISAEQKTGSG